MLKRVAGLTVGIVLVVAGGGAWFVYERLRSPYRAFSGEEVFVDLAPGTSVTGIGSRLAAAGVVPDETTFRIAVRVSGAERRLQAGEYRFAEAASPLEVVERLARGGIHTVPITFPEGLTIAEMAGTFGRSGLGTAEGFEQAGLDATRIHDLDPDAATLEGYLFPDTYRLPRRAGAERMVDVMVWGFRQAFHPDLRAEASRQGLTTREVVTLASLVEKETAAPEERPIVAAVYRNRLDRGMPLQCDPTVIYALILEGRWDGNLTRQDLQIDSPYNTYRYPGLPPGPIAAPGLGALEAVVRPADVPYLFFVSRNDGTHVFATTLAEHNRNVATWQIEYFRRPR